MGGEDMASLTHSFIYLFAMFLPIGPKESSRQVQYILIYFLKKLYKFHN